MFNIPFYQYKIENWISKKKNLLEICENIKFKNLNDQQRADIQTTSDNLYTDYGNNNEYSHHIIKILEDEFIKFSNDAKAYNLSVSDSWFQKYYKSQFHSPHDHGSIGYSSVTYINFNKKVHNPTIFVAPFKNAQGITNEYAPDVDEGDIIIFPSMITHYVLPSKTEELRTILSVNLKQN